MDLSPPRRRLAQGHRDDLHGHPEWPGHPRNPVILVTQEAPANAAGTIQFMDGDAELGPSRRCSTVSR
jgi:hypothetical protein